jgi:predicted acyltransferase
MAGDRLVSLDVFRGATIASMILVNNPGTWSAIYWPFDHAAWHGWTPTDLIFPFFLFMVGMTIHLSRKTTLAQAARRAAVLCGLGLFLNAFPFFHLPTWRIPGVLQRIAVCYLAVWMVRRVAGPAAQAGLAALLLVAYWLLMTKVPVPGIGAPNLEPATNLAAWIDSLVLTGHMYSLTKTWDPEGILSTLPAIATTLLGTLAGAWLGSSRPAPVRAAGFIGAGLILALAGIAWGESFPINKNLWTSSFVLLTGGLASALFGLCYLVADVWHYRRWTRPWVVYGANAIVVYVASSLLTRTLSVTKIGGVSLRTHAFEAVLVPWLPLPAASLVWALAMVAFWYLVLASLDRRGVRYAI